MTKSFEERFDELKIKYQIDDNGIGEKEFLQFLKEFILSEKQLSYEEGKKEERKFIIDYLRSRQYGKYSSLEDNLRRLETGNLYDSNIRTYEPTH